MSKTQRATEGFGCPTGVDPHHVCVVVPVARNEPVQIIERFGIRGGTNGLPDRCCAPGWSGPSGPQSPTT